MAEARNDIEKAKKAEVAAVEAKEAHKERIGKELVARSLSRKRPVDDGSSLESDERDVVDLVTTDSDGHGSARKKPRRQSQAYDNVEGELEGFGIAMRDADLARIELERERLLLERDRLKWETEAREKDREERRLECDAQNELDLKKMKIMMEAITRKH